MSESGKKMPVSAKGLKPQKLLLSSSTEYIEGKRLGIYPGVLIYAKV